MIDASDYEPVQFQSDDGLRLFARDYNSPRSTLTPLLCLPGLTRNSKDFETITPWLAQTRRVIAPDFRGRGLSENSRDPATYRPDVELADMIGLLDFLKVDRVAIIGTSRGGIVGMLMAALHRNRMAGLLLNDIGPELEPAGLLRIRTYLGVQAQFESWNSAVTSLRKSNPGFGSLTGDEWQEFAQRVFKSESGLPCFNYDPALARTFPTVEEIEAGRIAKLWDMFNCVAGQPVSILRGAHSDLLSSATVEAMKQINANLDATTVPNRGHAPFLDEIESKKAISRWLARVDANEKGR